MDKKDIDNRISRQLDLLFELDTSSEAFAKQASFIKDLFIQDILPEVLESVMPWNWDNQWDEYSGNDIEEEIKNIAKKQYNINL